MQEMWVRLLGWEDPLEKEMATQPNILAWRIPWTKEPGRLPVHGVARVGHDLVTKPPWPFWDNVLEVHICVVRTLYRFIRFSLLCLLFIGQLMSENTHGFVLLVSIDGELNYSWNTCFGNMRKFPVLIMNIFCIRLCPILYVFSSVQFSRTVCLTLRDPMNCSMPSFLVHHQFLELIQTHVHWVSDAIQLSHPLSSPSPPAFNLSQHQGLFQWVSSSHQVAKVLVFQLQHQSYQWIFRTDFL